VCCDEHYLIDGGPMAKKYFSNVKSCLEDSNAIDMITRKEKPVIHCNIIVTHPDRDHVNGIYKLMEDYCINGMIIITEAFDRKLRIEYSGFLKEKLTLTHLPVSSWSPASWQSLSSTRFICCQSPQEKCLLYVPHAHAYLYEHAYFDPLHRGSNRDWNKSSILTMIYNESDTEYAAVLTGDSFSDIVLSTSGLVGNHTQIFQVPHHGSKYNIKVGKEGTLDMCTCT
jgi:mRNA degradation ribonuclease J1/J2